MVLQVVTPDSLQGRTASSKPVESLVGCSGKLRVVENALRRHGIWKSQASCEHMQLFKWYSGLGTMDPFIRGLCVLYESRIFGLGASAKVARDVHPHSAPNARKDLLRFVGHDQSAIARKAA